MVFDCCSACINPCVCRFAIKFCFCAWAGPCLFLHICYFVSLQFPLLSLTCFSPGKREQQVWELGSLWRYVGDARWFQSPVPPGSGQVSGDRQLCSGSAPSLLLHLGQVTPLLWAAVSFIPLYHISTPVYRDGAHTGPCRNAMHVAQGIHVKHSAQCPACCFSNYHSLSVQGTESCSFGGQWHEIRYWKCLTQYLAHRPPQTLNDCDHSGYFHFFISGLIQLEVLRCPLECACRGKSPACT